MSLAVDISCIPGAIGKVDALTKITVVSAYGVAWIFAQALITKIDVTTFADRVANLFARAMKEGKDFDSFPGIPATVCFYALKG